ncbi:class I SAM-dependent methyltransferase [Saccharophagus sp. K07]|nr:class I SAM-dependent methyltransferase [Saccharophagus sp. K07]
MTMDSSTQILLQLMRSSDGNGLWLADESGRDIWPQIKATNRSIDVLTNRFDQAVAAEKYGIPTTFCDWEFASDHQYTHIYLRICKEKAINQHLIQEAWNHLTPGGALHIAGEKNEGIKTCWDFACEIFSSDSRLKKHGMAYCGSLTKTAEGKIEKNDSYHELVEISSWDGVAIFSKPGVFGWDKIDAGSTLLIEQLMEHTPAWETAKSILDLGCGYGFLTFASNWINCERRVATDNNAGALLCTQKNAAARGLNVEVVAGDKGDKVEGKFDLILCNPPFHRGFSVDGDLTQEFLTAAKTKLANNGTTLFVVNSFIPLEKKAAGLFSKIDLLQDNRQFKVFALRA